MSDRQPVLTHLARVPAKPTSWLWPSRLPRGYITLLLGAPSSGKSFLALDIAARTALGLPLPEPAATLVPQQAASENSPTSSSHPTSHISHISHIPHIPHPKCSRVLLISPTESLPESTVPRIHALASAFSAPLSAAPPSPQQPLVPSLHNIIHFTGFSDISDPDDYKRPYFPGAAKEFDSVIEEIAPCSLLIIDPLPSFLTIYETPHAGLIAAIQRLGELAARTNIAVLAVAPATRRLPPATYLSLLPTLTTAWLIDRDAAAPDLPGLPPRRLLLPLKSTLAPSPAPLPFTIEGSRITWHPADASADQAAIQLTSSLGFSRPVSLRLSDVSDEAAWLADLLSSSGGTLPAAEIARAAHDCGFAWRTVCRAKKFLAIPSRKRGQNTGAIWEWALPTAPDLLPLTPPVALSA